VRRAERWRSYWKAGRRANTALTRKNGAPQALAERARFWLRPPVQQQGDRGQGGSLCRNGRHMAQSLRGEPDGWPRRRAAPWAPREIGDDEIAATIRKTLETLPKGATHWSLRTRAIEIGHAPSTAIASGKPSGCSRTASRPSSSRPIRCSWRRCVRQAPVPARALHADISLMDQPSRTVLRATD
jgi:hypothetical protein